MRFGLPHNIVTSEARKKARLLMRLLHARPGDPASSLRTYISVLIDVPGDNLLVISQLPHAFRDYLPSDIRWTSRSPSNVVSHLMKCTNALLY